MQNFSKEAKILNTFFASQCTPLSTASTLPSMTYRFDKTHSFLHTDKAEIMAILRNPKLANYLNGKNYLLKSSKYMVNL